jgi:hypothetical protein
LSESILDGLREVIPILHLFQMPGHKCCAWL